MIVFKNNQDIYYAVFSNNFDLESLKRWLVFYRKFDESIKAYRQEDDSFVEIALDDEAQNDVVEEKPNGKKK